MAVAITRTELSSSELRREGGRTKDAKASRRMLALALVLDGRSRRQAAESCGMDRQTLRDWVHRYNAEGLAGLVDRPLSGRAPKLKPEQMIALASIVEKGPDSRTDGLVRWRGSTCARSSSVVSACAWPGEPWARSCAGSALSGCRRDRRRARRKPRSHIKNFAELVRAKLPGAAQGKPLEIWFQEFAMAAAIGPRPMADARIGQQGMLTRLRVRKGTRPRAPKDCHYTWVHIFGAVCAPPERRAPPSPCHTPTPRP